MAEPGIDGQISLFLDGAKRREQRGFRGAGLAALLVAAVPPALVVAAGGLPGLGSLILAVLFGWPAYKLAKRLSRGRRRRLHKRLAEEFQTLFSDAGAHYEFALRRMILTKGRDPLVKALAEHLPGARKIMAETAGGTVRFMAETWSASETGETKPFASQGAQSPSDLIAQIKGKAGMSGMADLPSFASKEELLDYVKTHPNVKATYTEGTTESGGTFRSVRIVQTGSGPPPAGPAPVRTPTRETPTQEPERTGTIPLDPYDAANEEQKG